MLDGIAVRGEDGIDRDLVAFRAGAGLDADGGFVVVARNGAVGAFEDETALGLGLVGPGIGEGAPAGFAFAEAEAVADDGDGVLVHLQPGGFVPDAGDFQRGPAAEVPGAEGGAVAHVVEQGAPALRLAVKPAGGFFGGAGFFFDLVGAVVKRAAIAAVVVEFADFADEAFLDEAVGGLLAGIPDEGPVDGEELAVGLHGGDHGIGLGQRSGEGFLHDDVGAKWGDLGNPVAVIRSGGTEDDDVGLRLLHAGAVVGEDLGIGEAEIPLGVHEACGLLIANAHDLGVRVLGGLAQQVAHVEVIEIDAGDAPFFAHRGCIEAEVPGDDNLDLFCRAAQIFQRRPIS